MNIEEYKKLVIELFKSGKASDAQYDEMADAVLDASENESYRTTFIDMAIMPDPDELKEK